MNDIIDIIKDIGTHSVILIRINCRSGGDLLEIVDTGGSPAAFSCAVERRQQNSRQNGDDGNDYE